MPWVQVSNYPKQDGPICDLVWGKYEGAYFGTGLAALVDDAASSFNNLFRNEIGVRSFAEDAVQKIKNIVGGRERNMFLGLMPRTDVERLREAIRGKENKYSLVVQIQLNDGRGILLTGDAEKGTLADIDNQILLDKYWVLKAPHHGTKFHFWIPGDCTIENLLISNGENTSRCGGIAEGYGKQSNIEAIRCLNISQNRCEIYEKCTCENCQAVDSDKLSGCAASFPHRLHSEVSFCSGSQCPCWPHVPTELMGTIGADEIRCLSETAIGEVDLEGRDK